MNQIKIKAIFQIINTFYKKQQSIQSNNLNFIFIVCFFQYFIAELISATSGCRSGDLQ
jgi:hypothetical protein